MCAYHRAAHRPCSRHWQQHTRVILGELIHVPPATTSNASDRPIRSEERQVACVVTRSTRRAVATPAPPAARTKQPPPHHHHCCCCCARSGKHGAVEIPPQMSSKVHQTDDSLTKRVESRTVVCTPRSLPAPLLNSAHCASSFPPAACPVHVISTTHRRPFAGRSSTNRSIAPTAPPTPPIQPQAICQNRPETPHATADCSCAYRQQPSHHHHYRGRHGSALAPTSLPPLGRPHHNEPAPMGTAAAPLPPPHHQHPVFTSNLSKISP